MITLLVRQGNQPEAEIKVNGDSAVVGRAPGSELRLSQTYVSKRHLRVLRGIVIVDMGSSNGTFLDGKRLKEPLLYTGGELRIGDGDVFMSVRIDEPEAQGDSSTRLATGDSALLRLDAEKHREAVREENERLRPLLEEARKKIRELESKRATPAKEKEKEPEPTPARLVEAEAALERANAEVAALRAQIAALENQEARPAAPASPAAELFLKLQSENSTLKRKLAELQAKSPVLAAPVPATTVEGKQSKLLAEIVDLRAQNAALRASGGTGVMRANSGSVRGLFARLAKDDVDRQAPLLTGSVEDFLVIEQFRLVRNVERIVTRMAGDVIQLLDGKTMLPDLKGNNPMLNMRQLIARMTEGAEDEDARADLMAYSAQLSRWLVASLGAPRKAATSFAQRLKTDLGEEALIAIAPIPAFKRLSGQADAELWRRAASYLRELTPDMIEDRLEKLSRAAALELVGEDSAASLSE